MNESDFITSTFDGGTGFTTVTGIPEPYASLLGLLCAVVRRR